MRTHVESTADEDGEEEQACEEIIVELIGATESRFVEDTETEQDGDTALEAASPIEPVYTPRTENRLKVFVCGQCHYSCSRAFDLRRHEESHTRAKPIEGIAFQCNKCTYTTKHKRNIKRHVARHVQLTQQFEIANEDDLTSEEVIVEMINSEDLRTETEHEVEIEPVMELKIDPELEPEREPTAESDPPASPSPSPVKEVEASAQKLFKCDKCKYVTKRGFDLRRHERRHTKVRVLDGTAVKCPECPFVTKWKRNIRRHMEQHRRKAREEDQPNSTKQIFENLVQNLRWDCDTETVLIEPIITLEAENTIPKEKHDEQELLDSDTIEAEEEDSLLVELLEEVNESEVLPSYWVALNLNPASNS